MLTQDVYIAQAGTGALLNPRIDSTFKALFTQPNEDSRAAMHAFLEAATERRIATWEISQNEAPIEYFGHRSVSFDISCVFDDGMAADIEMQAFRQPYDYGQRAEYLVARLASSRMKRSVEWEKAPTVYQISVLDFEYVPQSGVTSPDPVSRYAMRTKDGRELANALNIVFIELPKVAKLEASLESNTALENWGIFLKDADDPEKRGLIQDLMRKEKGLMEAHKALSLISADDELWYAQFKQEKAERDYISGIKSAERKAEARGEARGRAEGEARGRAEGARKKAIENARNMLADGVTPELIAKWTGLTIEEVVALQSSISA